MDLKEEIKNQIAIELNHWQTEILKMEKALQPYIEIDPYTVGTIEDILVTMKNRLKELENNPQFQNKILQQLELSLKKEDSSKNIPTSATKKSIKRKTKKKNY